MGCRRTRHTRLTCRRCCLNRGAVKAAAKAPAASWRPLRSRDTHRLGCCDAWCHSCGSRSMIARGHPVFHPRATVAALTEERSLAFSLHLFRCAVGTE